MPASAAFACAMLFRFYSQSQHLLACLDAPPLNLAMHYRAKRARP